MAFIETVPPAEAIGDVKVMYARSEAHYGFVPNYTKIFCHRPEILTLWSKLLSEIQRPMDKRRFELVTFAAANALESSYCSLAHGQALTEFFSTEEVRAIADDLRPGPLSDAEWAMTDLSRKVALGASAVEASDVETLKEHGLTDAEIFDIVAASAGRAFLSKLVEGLGAAADSAFLDIDSSLRESLTVGRSIDSTAQERLPVEP
jgi:uncharacterized peroxidase-related enzyme